MLVHEGDDDLDQVSRRLDLEGHLVVVVCSATHPPVNGADAKERLQGLAHIGVARRHTNRKGEPPLVRRRPEVPSAVVKPPTKVAVASVTRRMVIMRSAQPPPPYRIPAPRDGTRRRAETPPRWVNLEVPLHLVSPALELDTLGAGKKILLGEGDRRFAMAAEGRDAEL